MVPFWLTLQLLCVEENCVEMCACVRACATAVMMKAGRLLCCSDILSCKHLKICSMNKRLNGHMNICVNE